MPMKRNSATGGLPLLTPMSEVAGRLAPQVGAHCLERPTGGRGVLLAGVPGVPAARSSFWAAASWERTPRRCARHGRNVIVADRDPEALRKIDLRFGSSVRTIFSTGAVIAELVKRAIF